MKKKKVIVWMLVILLLVYVGSVIYKYSVLTKISNSKEVRENIDIYSCNIVNLLGSNENTIISTTYKSGNVQKILQTLKHEGNEWEVILWEDENEKVAFTQNGDESSCYEVESIDTMAMNSSSLNTMEDEKGVRLLLAMNPLVTITSTNYNDEECYNITTYSSGKQVERVQKDIGVLLYALYNNGTEVFYDYNFDVN